MENLNEIKGILIGSISYSLDPRIINNTNFQKEVNEYFLENNIKNINLFLFEKLNITLEYTSYRNLFIAINLHKNLFDKVCLSYKLEQKLPDKNIKTKVNKI